MQGGGLAGAVGAEEADDLALADLEADVVDGCHGAEALDQALRFEDCHPPIMAGAGDSRT